MIVAIRPLPWILASSFFLASCSFGPQLQTRMPQVRNVPVLANLEPREALARARAFLASKQFGLAIELFKGAGRDPALQVDSLNGMAIAYDGIGRADLAERYFQKALALRADDDRTRRNLATFYAASGQQEKRRALLASTAALPVTEPASTLDPPKVERAAFDGAPPDLFADTAEAIDVAAELDPLSPLGSAFRPLLASANLPSRPALASGSGTVSVVCATGGTGAAPTPSGGTMAIFRLNIGEVFITSRPDGSNCHIDGGADTDAPTPQLTAMSNKDYLGLVAAYLDRVNRMQLVLEMSLTKRATL